MIKLKFTLALFLTTISAPILAKNYIESPIRVWKYPGYVTLGPYPILDLQVLTEDLAQKVTKF